jgi:hypothetical protein
MPHRLAHVQFLHGYPAPNAYPTVSSYPTVTYMPHHPHITNYYNMLQPATIPQQLATTP